MSMFKKKSEQQIQGNNKKNQNPIISSDSTLDPKSTPSASGHFIEDDLETISLDSTAAASSSPTAATAEDPTLDTTVKALSIAGFATLLSTFITTGAAIWENGGDVDFNTDIIIGLAVFNAVIFALSYTIANTLLSDDKTDTTTNSMDKHTSTYSDVSPFSPYSMSMMGPY